MRDLGDILVGRPKLGDQMPVLVYRLFEMAMLDVLANNLGKEKADDMFRQAGHLSGMHFAKNNLSTELDFNDFVNDLQEKLCELKIGILRIERADLEKGELQLSVYEDLDCSGLPVTDETVCVYDEGFLAGILEYYTGKPFTVREVDCWATGDRVCRFHANANQHS